jgi:hypothetical protein
MFWRWQQAAKGTGDVWDDALGVVYQTTTGGSDELTPEEILAVIQSSVSDADAASALLEAADQKKKKAAAAAAGQTYQAPSGATPGIPGVPLQTRKASVWPWVLLGGGALAFYAWRNR